MSSHGMNPDGYRLLDLARLSGQKGRTIRSWIDRGLLHGPDSLGRGARYDGDHLLRVRVIAALRDDHDMGLDAIGVVLERSSREELAVLLETAPAERGLEPTGEGAVDYVRRAREEAEEEFGRLMAEVEASASEPDSEGGVSLGAERLAWRRRWLRKRSAPSAQLMLPSGTDPEPTLHEPELERHDRTALARIAEARMRQHEDSEGGDQKELLAKLESLGRSSEPQRTPRSSRVERWLEVRVTPGVYLKVRDHGTKEDEEWARELAGLLRGLIDRC